MFAVCWVSPLMDSSAAALFVASTKTQKLHDASSCICRICASSIILDFKKHQLVFHPQYPSLILLYFRQNCTVEIESYGYTVSDVVMYWRVEPVVGVEVTTIKHFSAPVYVFVLVFLSQ